MSLDNMRGSYGRCPPFLVGGLLVVCCILTFNWWSLSTQNYDLIKQIEELGEQLKISSEEQDLCVHQRMSVESRIKNMEEEMAQLRVRLEQQRSDNDETNKSLAEKEDELKNVNKEKEDAKSSLVACNTELDSLKKLGLSKDGIIETLRLEKDQFNSQLDERKQESQKLKAELQEVQAKLAAMNSKPPEEVRQAVKLSLAVTPPAAIHQQEIGVLVGANHDRVRALDLDKEIEDNNNAAEKVDEANVDDAGDADPAQAEDVPRMVEPPEVEEAKKESGLQVTDGK